MSLVDVGSRCSTCSIVDFLPIVCAGCTQEYCAEHIHDHNCPASATHDHGDPERDRGVARDASSTRCALATCDRPSLDSLAPHSGAHVLCDACGLAFCAYHRDPGEHSCSPVAREPVEQRNAEAHALLERYFRPSTTPGIGQSQSQISTGTSDGRARRPPTDPTKIARRDALELMKLRHRAKPADPRDTAVVQHDRVHVRVNQQGRPAGDNKLLWFKKSISTGRAVDLCATLFAIHRDHSSPQLALFAIRPDDRSALIPLPNERALGEHVSDGANLILAAVDAIEAAETTTSSSSMH